MPIGYVNLADNPIQGGTDPSTGEPFYVCRAYVNGDIVVGKALLSIRTCWLPFHNGEHRETTNVEVLTNPNSANFKWVSNVNGLPPQAIKGGRTADREDLYIGRCTLTINGRTMTIPGKIHWTASRNMYVSYELREYQCENYDVLVCLPGL